MWARRVPGKLKRPASVHFIARKIMNRLTDQQRVRDDAPMQPHAATESPDERIKAAHSRHYAASHYDWMDHHSTFETKEW
jgi:hypothetical protein